MDLFFIRHTSVDVPKGLCYGHSNVPLSKSFEVESQQVLSQLKGVNIDRIYSSPLSRCTDLAGKINASYKTDDRLKELNFGDWEGLKWDDLNNEYGLKWMNDYVNLSCPNGESFQNLMDRFEQFIKEVENKNEHLILVTHSGIIRAAYHYFNNIPIKKLFDVAVLFGSVHTFKL
ncbi:MAG: alpha-ribazole phosphatase [Bacteroidetes bacterium]|nr:alpha-ribazole phosphatase [Bacteroidota bacterium]